MAPSHIIFSYASNYSGGYLDYYRQMVEARNRAEHRAFIDSLAKQAPQEALNEKSISLLTRSVKRPKVARHIRQPAWRAGRWKSLT